MNDIYDLLYKNVSIMMILYDHMQYLYINICAHGMIYIYIYAHTSTIYHTPWERADPLISRDLSCLRNDSELKMVARQMKNRLSMFPSILKL